MRIERLARHHDRKCFDCGNYKLNDFLQRTARQHAERGLSRTFVLINEASPKAILGYYTLTICEVIPSQIPDARLQRYPHPMPAAKLARLAISLEHQGLGLGTHLLLDAMARSARISNEAGLVGLFVDAKDDEAASYYQRFGFISTGNDSLVLYLPMATVCQAVDFI